MQEAARRLSWERGDLRYKLHDDQLRVYEAIQANTFSRFVLEIARRWGKTWLLAAIAIETCLRHPKSRVVYGAPTLKDLAEFIIPTFEALTEDAPEHLRSHYNEKRGHWEFPHNGSYVHLFGCDDKRKANRGRGPAARKAILDEAGFNPVLRYVMRSVLRPQLMYLPPEERASSMLIGSTPAETPDHDFTEVAEKAEANGNYARRTIDDNPRLSTEMKLTFIEDDAKEESLSVEQYQQTDEYRREYRAERVIDRQLVVVPEWLELGKQLTVRRERPPFFDAVSVLDFGGVDPHFAIWGYWHFEKALLHIERCLCLRNGETTAEIAEHVKRIEKELYGEARWNGTLRGLEEEDPERRRLLDTMPSWMRVEHDELAPRQPWARWCDNDIQLARDLSTLHGLAYIPTAKDHAELDVNALRVLIRAGQLTIDPSCVDLDRHLRTTTWANLKRRDFARRGGEHGDGVACLKYLVRNMTRRNPSPRHLLRGGRAPAQPRPESLALARALRPNFGG